MGYCFYTAVALWLFEAHLSSYATFKENIERLSIYAQSMLSSFHINGIETTAVTRAETVKSLCPFPASGGGSYPQMPSAYLKYLSSVQS